MRILKPLFTLGTAIVSVSFLFAQSNASNAQVASQIYLGHPAPDFKLKDLDGQELQLSSLRGHVVLLDFWASWCGPCRAEIPMIEHLAKQFEKKDVIVLGINAGEEEGVVRNFADKFKMNYRNLLSNGSNVSSQYGARALPSVVMIDKDGIIAAYRVGEGTNTEDMLRDDLHHITSSKYVAPTPISPQLPAVETRSAPAPSRSAVPGPDPNWSPQTPEEVLARGYRRLHTGKASDAIADAAAVLASRPDSIAAHYLHGEASYAAKDYATAIQDLDECLLVKPDWATAHRFRGLAYSYSGHHDKAIADYEQAIALEPHLAANYNSLGWACLELGDFERARINLNKALELSPDFIIALENRAKLYAKLEQPAEEMKDLKLIVNLQPNDKWAKDTLAAIDQPHPVAAPAAVQIDPTAPSDPALLSPKLIAPAAGAVFNFYPRLTFCEWEPVEGASSYLVEWDYSYNGKWNNEWHQSNGWGYPVNGTQYTFEFVGAQPGHFRVWPVNKAGVRGAPSEWREFRYTK